VKELHRPTPQAVSKAMNKSVEEVKDLFRESVRQKKGITLEKTNNGEIFVT
jgi:hypothetical protein